jgi:hypothetical protein
LLRSGIGALREVRRLAENFDGTGVGVDEHGDL